MLRQDEQVAREQPGLAPGHVAPFIGGPEPAREREPVGLAEAAQQVLGKERQHQVSGGLAHDARARRSGRQVVDRPPHVGTGHAAGVGDGTGPRVELEERELARRRVLHEIEPHQAVQPELRADPREVRLERRDGAEEPA
jgi:hypothetical protein